MVNASTDIRQIKTDLRIKYRGLRENIPKAEKDKHDADIYEKVINSKFYLEAKTVLCFVSTDIEVDTKRLMQKAFEDGKIVAVPKCLDKKGKMDFFIIRGFDELRPSFFGLLEPDEEKTPRLTDYNNSISILPGFAFDKNGYRIGYGKGYYDRFLQKYNGLKIGVCYNQCIAKDLPHGRYDVSADYIITPKYTLTIKK